MYAGAEVCRCPHVAPSEPVGWMAGEAVHTPRPSLQAHLMLVQKASKVRAMCNKRTKRDSVLKALS